MENNYCIYRHTSPSGKVYIGITSKNPNIRWQNGTGYVKCTLFHKAILKYGWDAIKHEILFCNLSKEKAIHLEIEFIRHYKNLGISYNITEGGEGCVGVPCSEINKQRIGALYRGKHMPEKTRLAIIKANKGRKLTKEHCERIRLGKLGNDNRAKPILQYSPSGVFIRQFSSVIEAAEFLGVSPTNIGAVARGVKKKKTAYGYVWRYVEKSG